MDVSGSGTLNVGTTTFKSYPYTTSATSGAMLTIEARPSFGFVFDKWSGDYDGERNPAVITVGCDTSIIANFRPDWILIGTTGTSLVLIVFLIWLIVTRRRQEKLASATETGGETGVIAEPEAPDA